MSTINEGGDAFPGAGPSGMTLRVYLAAQFLPAIIAKDNQIQATAEVEDAIWYADEMIRQLTTH